MLHKKGDRINLSQDHTGNEIMVNGRLMLITEDSDGKLVLVHYRRRDGSIEVITPRYLIFSGFGWDHSLRYKTPRESIRYTLEPGSGDFYDNLVGFDISEIATRMLALCFFMIFGSHAQFTINKRKEAEQALQESEEKYRTIIQGIEDGYYEVDLAGRISFFNDATMKILSIPENKIIGVNFRHLLDQEDTNRLLETFDQVLHTGNPVDSFGCKIPSLYDRIR